MSSYRLNSLFARRTLSDRDPAGDAEMRPRWALVTGASLGIGGYLTTQALLAGAPIGESLFGGTIVAVALFLYYAIVHSAITQGESFSGAVAVRQGLRLPAVRRTLKGTAVVAGLLVLGVGLAPGAQARTSCSYAGPPTNVLTVTVSGESIGEIKRRGLDITANDFLARPRPCSGGTPTVLNTDAISVLVGPDAFANVRLDGGPFAPGATPETEGASEMEIEIQSSGPFTLANIVGTPRGDEFHWGPGGASAGLNLNPRSAGDKDVDVTTSEEGVLIAEGAGGNDKITAEPGALVNDLVFAQGGRGNDVLSAPQSTSGILDGGPGNDTIAGGGGSDAITGGPGKDRLLGGEGGDSIKSRDSKRDMVGCGSGRDRVTADRRDRVRGCERISRR